MIPQRRTALVSVGAAAALVALKLVPGITTNSLGLISEALHSGTDLVAALLTFFAIGVASRPADRAHAYGHGKAEHLAALAEAGFLAAASVFIIWRGVSHLTGRTEPTVDATWYALAVIGAVIVIDASRTIVSLRTAAALPQRRAAGERSPLRQRPGGLDRSPDRARLLVRAGYNDADSAAALFVAVLVHRRRGAAHPPQRRRPDGPRAGRCLRGGAGRDRGTPAARPAAPAADPAGRRAPLRRRRHRRRARGRSARGTPPPTRSRRRSSARCRRPTSSSTSSRATSRACASGSRQPPHPSRRSARSTT